MFTVVGKADPANLQFGFHKDTPKFILDLIYAENGKMFAAVLLLCCSCFVSRCFILRLSVIPGDRSRTGCVKDLGRVK